MRVRGLVMVLISVGGYEEVWVRGGLLLVLMLVLALVLVAPWGWARSRGCRREDWQVGSPCW